MVRTRNDEYGRTYTEKMRKHLEAVRPAYGENGFYGRGRPIKKDIIAEYQDENPYHTRYRCSIETGISYKTVSKWWDMSKQLYYDEEEDDEYEDDE